MTKVFWSILSKIRNPQTPARNPLDALESKQRGGISQFSGLEIHRRLQTAWKRISFSEGRVLTRINGCTAGQKSRRQKQTAGAGGRSGRQEQTIFHFSFFISHFPF
jgi:hypothetical protein